MESFSKDIHAILRELNQSEREADEIVSVVALFVFFWFCVLIECNWSRKCLWHFVGFASAQFDSSWVVSIPFDTIVCIDKREREIIKESDKKIGWSLKIETSTEFFHLQNEWICAFVLIRTNKYVGINGFHWFLQSFKKGFDEVIQKYVQSKNTPVKPSKKKPKGRTERAENYGNPLRTHGCGHCPNDVVERCWQVTMWQQSILIH